MMAKRKKEAGPGGILMSFKGGVSSFIERLAKSMEASIETNSKVKKIAKEEDKVRLFLEDKSLLFDRVILSTPAFVSAKFLKEIDNEIAKRLEEIEYSPISIVGLGYEEFAHELKGFGLLTTTSAKKDILGVLWDSSIFIDRAPNGKKSLRVMIGGQRDPQNALKSEDELVKMAIEGIKETMGVSAKPSVTYVKRYERGIPNYRVGHLANVDEIMKRVKNLKNIYLNSNAYYGVGLNDCVKNSKESAIKIAKDINEG
jgi:oxygen-dependent protoporphyrinogen oxidase